MNVDWQLSYKDKKGNVILQGYSTSTGVFEKYLQTELYKEIKYYSGSTSFNELINSLSETGFDTTTMKETVESSQKIVFWRWGEYFAYDQIKRHLGITIPWPPSWDRRIRTASLPGSDIIALKNEGGNVIFVFGEIKTSSQEKHPPYVVTKGKEGMIDQLKKLFSREIISDLVKWLLLRSNGRVWEDDFKKAVEYYSQNDSGYELIGVLVRDTDPDIQDLKCVLENFEMSEILISFYGYYLPYSIDYCINICLNGGGNNAIS